METRISDLDVHAVDARDRLARIETRLDIFATKADLHREFHFIDQLLSMRTKAGLTQEQVAERMQTQKSNVSRLETY